MNDIERRRVISIAFARILLSLEKRECTTNDAIQAIERLILMSEPMEDVIRILRSEINEIQGSRKYD